MQRQIHARREHRVHETKSVARHHPARPVTALGDELVVGVSGDLRQAAAVPAGGGQQRVAVDRGLQPFLGGRAQLRGVVLVHHHADGQAVAQRDAPAPAGGQPADDDLSRRPAGVEAFVVREVGHVFARADFRGNFHGARKETAASGGINEQIRLPAVKPRRLRERLLGQSQSIPVHPLDLAPARARVLRPAHRHVRQTTGRTPDAGRCRRKSACAVMGERLETKLDLLVRIEGERDARFVLANRRGALFQSQFPQHRHHRRDERLADDRVRAGGHRRKVSRPRLSSSAAKRASRPTGRCR